MSLPTKTRAFRRTQDGKIQLVEEAIPELQPTQVLLKIHAVSLNYRDAAMLRGLYPPKIRADGVPASDGSATVIAVGNSVDKFKVGDYVTPGTEVDYVTPTEKLRGLGNNTDGLLTEYLVEDQAYITSVPEHLSYEEAATICCAGVTAWTALDIGTKKGKVRTALLLGSGGVSLCALLICLGAGITPIITSSSDKKLEQIKKLGKEGEILGINYNTHPDWDKEVLRLTDGAGVDVVVDNVGASAMQKCVNSLASFGTISCVGFLGGWESEQTADVATACLMKTANVRGIAMGSIEEQQAFCDFLAEKKVSLKPLLDKTFAFEDSQAAFDYLWSGAHVGKIIIKF